MGVVWKAVDTTLDRDLAIKILPEAFSADSDRLARFEREAKLLASLSHTGIATIHGLHQAGGIRFLAMELVGGENPSKRLGRGSVPVREALRIALQVEGRTTIAPDLHRRGGSYYHGARGSSPARPASPPGDRGGFLC